MSERRRIGRGKKLAIVAATTAILLGLTEVGLRLAGFKPRERPGASARGGSRNPFHGPHDLLGYALKPGSFTGEAWDGEWSRQFRVTVDERGRRITHPPRPKEAPARPEIWIFGCSVTFGALLNDDETYPWIVQEKLPEYEVVNFGVGAYSTLQSLIQLEETLEETPRPRVALAVLAYAAFHDERNVSSRSWRQRVGGGRSRPFARFGRDGKLERGMMPPGSTMLPLADRLVLVAGLDSVANVIADGGLRESEVSHELILELAALCRSEGIPFFVAGISSAEAMLETLRGEGIRTGVVERKRGPGMTFAPHDPHPSPAGARALGEAMAEVLKTALR